MEELKYICKLIVEQSIHFRYSNQVANNDDRLGAGHMALHSDQTPLMQWAD